MTSCCVGLNVTRCTQAVVNYSGVGFVERVCLFNPRVRVWLLGEKKVNEVNGSEKLHEAFRGNGRVVEKVFEGFEGGGTNAFNLERKARIVSGRGEAVVFFC